MIAEYDKHMIARYESQIIAIAEETIISVDERMNKARPVINEFISRLQEKRGGQHDVSSERDALSVKLRIQAEEMKGINDVNSVLEMCLDYIDKQYNAVINKAQS
jgi:hypothetical protein